MPKVNRAFNKVEYNNQYNKENYCRINLVLPKELRPIIDTAVKEAGTSKNAFIKAAILEKIEREGTKC